ncbi:amidohydrolase family protein, partial [Cupriavidus sp. 2MCAB6]|uniref:amidohydrolase family protein n=1 Tax=Cupriavidus sp. 2MCAB6 TaxID=3232981 RepID=UPI003F911E08
MLDVRMGQLRSDICVSIQGERIVEISDRPPSDGDGETIDLGGRVLMPGMIDCHAHVTAVQLNLAPTRQLPVSLVTAGASRIMRDMLM